MILGKVYLIGAGCGEYDLITLRGMELLKQSDVVIYDSLIDEHLLDLVPDDAEKICVGKRAGRHSELQENINKLLVEKAMKSKITARLKGGDPFVFGRGGEEILFLMEHDIPFEIVPGITSAIAVPELAGIPVTHRSVSRSFHVITGHTKEDLLPTDMQLYAKLSGTLVFLMGLENLKNIAESLIEYGKSPSTPAAVISNGGRKNQKAVRGTLANIAEISEKNDIQSPAVIVVGDTAAFTLYEYHQRELDEVSVTVTGTKRFSDRLAAKLENYGASVKRVNIMHVETYENSREFINALSNITAYSMIVLTSPNGAEIFIQKLKKLSIDFRKLHHIRFAVIGNATAAVLEEHGFYADIMPEIFTSAELGSAIILNAADKENVLILRAEQSSSELTDILRNGSIQYEEVKIYDVIGDNEIITNEISTDFIVFASRSGVRDFYKQGYTISPDTTAICIGTATASELNMFSKKDPLIPEIQNSSSIVELIKKLKGSSK